jgi:hypothetical protein
MANQLACLIWRKTVRKVRDILAREPRTIQEAAARWLFLLGQTLGFRKSLGLRWARELALTQINGCHKPGRSTSGIGTFETSRDVRSSVAIEGKPDMSRTWLFGSV